MMAGVMAALVFSSCKKDKDSESDNGGDGSTKLLKKVTETANGPSITLISMETNASFF